MFELDLGQVFGLDQIFRLGLDFKLSLIGLVFSVRSSNLNQSFRLGWDLNLSDQIFELVELLELGQAFRVDWDFSLMNQAFGVGSGFQTGLKL